MSALSEFVDALKSLFGSKRDVDIEVVRSEGGLGSTVGTNAFDPLRPTPEPDSGANVDTGEMTVKSADPEEGGEYHPVDD